MKWMGREIVLYFHRIWEYRYFWYSLSKADLQRRYRRSVLGMGWSLLQPIAMALVLCLVYGKIFSEIPIRELALFLLSGFAIWNFITSVILQGCGCFLLAESYIRQETAPLAIYPLRTVLTGGFHGVIALSLPLVLSLVLGKCSLLTLVSLLPGVLLLFLFGWSVALLAGYAHVYFSDTQHLVEIGLQVLFFLTPVIYPPKVLIDRGMGWLVKYNPLANLIGLLREPIWNGDLMSFHQYEAAVGMVAVCVLLAMTVSAKFERELIFAL